MSKRGREGGRQAGRKGGREMGWDGAGGYREKEGVEVEEGKKDEEDEDERR